MSKNQTNRNKQKNQRPATVFKPISLVVTVLNEEASIVDLLTAIQNQSLPASEVIIVDGGSTDGTLKTLRSWQKKIPYLKVQKKKGNRSIGRNTGISQAKNELIAITDAGCTPHDDWLLQLAKTYHQKTTQLDILQLVVAGYYDAEATTPFQEAVVPYALVMPDKVDPDGFLPATRSMMMTKTVWKQMGGFNEDLNDNEDYDFSRRLQRLGTPIVFAKDAKVTWHPRSTLKEFWTMIFRFARGDAFAGLFRAKVVLIFVRYAVGLSLILAFVVLNRPIILMLATSGFILYSAWSISKNIKYVPNGWYWLPTLQVVSDLAVLLGTSVGLIQRSTT